MPAKWQMGFNSVFEGLRSSGLIFQVFIDEFLGKYDWNNLLWWTVGCL